MISLYKKHFGFSTPKTVFVQVLSNKMFFVNKIED